MLRETLESTEFAKTLKEIDRWLLLNRPGLWVIRLPYLAAYAVIANLGVYLIIQALPLKLHHVGSIFPILWVVFLTALGVFIFWVTRFNRHSAERAFEKTSALKGLVDFLIYLGCILALLSPSITASFALVERFDDMISLEEVREDALITENGLYSIELVEKYTGLNEAAQNGMSTLNIKWFVRDNLLRMADIKESPFAVVPVISNLNIMDIPYAPVAAFLTLSVIASHFSLVMFTIKHTGIKTIYRTVAYGFGIVFLLGFLSEYLDKPWIIIGSLHNGLNLGYFVWRWAYLIFLGIITLIACSVFWLKHQREFVMMNIVLLPLAVYMFLVFIFIIVSIIGHSVHFELGVVKEHQLGLMPFTPLIYIWLIPLLKAMYMRLLSLPREG